MKQFDPNNINGVIPAMITSFNKDESINKEGIRKTINYLISKKVNALYITGSTGETFLMSQDEKKQVIEIIVEEVNGRVPVIAHIGSIGTKITTELGQYAEKIGVDALSALPPFYYGFSNDEIFSYYKDISFATTNGQTTLLSDSSQLGRGQTPWQTFSYPIGSAGTYTLGMAVMNWRDTCLLYTSPSPRDQRGSRMPSSA